MSPINKTSPIIKPLVIVLTGGIASGKTAVSKLFEQLDVPVIDTDEIAHRLVEPGQPVLSTLAEVFGSNYLLPNGELNRQKMRRTIFSNSSAKSSLEAILHPAISIEVLNQIHSIDTPYCILVIPLFVESNSYDWVDRILLVDTPVETQINRVMARDHTNKKEANAILNAQSSRQQRLSVADDVIDNNSDFSDLRRQVHNLHSKYLKLAINASRN